MLQSDLLTLASLLQRYHDELMLKARLATTDHAIDYYCERLVTIQRAENDILTTLEVQDGRNLSTLND